MLRKTKLDVLGSVYSYVCSEPSVGVGSISANIGGVVMSLSEAVISVADEMEKTASDPTCPEVVLRAFLRSFARELRTAVKASGGSSPFPSPVDHQRAIDQCRAEFRGKKEKQEEASDGRMVEVVGGPYNLTYVNIDSSMPLDAKTKLDEVSIYALREDNKLHFVG